MVKGEGKISGEERHVPSLRQVAVARAYVQGLEEDRERLHKLEETVTSQIWEIVSLGSFNRALQRVLTRFLADLEQGKYDPGLHDLAEQLLGEAKLVHDQIFTCPCGHSKWDHDEGGCVYLGCKHICG